MAIRLHLHFQVCPILQNNKGNVFCLELDPCIALKCGREPVLSLFVDSSEQESVQFLRFS